MLDKFRYPTNDRNINLFAEKVMIKSAKDNQTGKYNGILFKLRPYMKTIIILFVLQKTIRLKFNLG